MPIYRFYCPDCKAEEEVLLPISKRDITRSHSCGCTMQRIMALPQPPIMKLTARDMALSSLNGDGKRDGLSPHEKGIGLEKEIMQGLERNRPMQYRGF